MRVEGGTGEGEGGTGEGEGGTGEDEGGIGGGALMILLTSDFDKSAFALSTS